MGDVRLDREKEREVVALTAAGRFWCSNLRENTASKPFYAFREHGRARPEGVGLLSASQVCWLDVDRKSARPRVAIGERRSARGQAEFCCFWCLGLAFLSCGGGFGFGEAFGVLVAGAADRSSAERQLT